MKLIKKPDQLFDSFREPSFFNLYNNQNYILWNIEKKNILIQFFIEQHYLIFLKKLNYSSNLIFSGHLLFIIPILAIYLIYPYLTSNIEKYLVFVFFWLFSFIFFVYFYIINDKKNKHKMTNLTDYFFKKWTNFNVNFILASVKSILFIWLYIHYVWNYISISNLSWVFKYILFLFWFVFGLYLIININFLNLILFPFFLIYFLIYTLMNYIKLLFWKNEFKVLKTQAYNRKKLIIFDYITEDSASSFNYNIYKK